MSVHAKGVEETSADVEPKRRNRLSFGGQIPSAVAPGEQRREGLLLRADLLPQRLGENRPARIPPAHPPLAVLVDPNRQELIGLLDGKRAETERVDELENRRVGAGAERQGQDRHEREGRVLSKDPHAVAEVVEHGSGTRGRGLERSSRCRPSLDRKSTRLNSSHITISYAVFCLKKKKRTVTSLHTSC